MGDIFSGNPYLNDPRYQLPEDQQNANKVGSLGQLLLGLATGISGQSGTGQPWFNGVAPGLAMGVNSVGQSQAQLAKMQMGAAQFDQMEAYRKAQEDALKEQTTQRQFENKMDKDIYDKFFGPGGPGAGAAVPGMGVTPPTPGMGPGGLGGGVNPNNIGNVRPPGSSTGFQQPPDFDSGVGLTVSNAKAYPKAFNAGQPMNLMQIGEKWAPKGDGANDPHQWAVNVSQFSGLPLNQPLNLDDPQVAAAFARGVHGAEKGAQAVRPVEAYLPGVTKGQQPGGYMRTQGPQVAQGPVIPQGGDAVAGQPGGSPAGGPQVFQPPPVGQVAPYALPGNLPDPSQYDALAVSKRFAPLGTALRGSAEFKRKEALDLEKFNFDRQQKAEQQALETDKALTDKANRPVVLKPDGTATPNQAVMETEAQKAAAIAKAQKEAELAYAGASTLTKAEMERYSKDVRPGAEATANGLPNLYEMKRLLDSPIAAGPFLDSRQLGARVKDMLGLGDLSDPMVSRTEFANRAGKQALAILQTRALGSGTGISEGDRKFVEKMSASGGDFTQEELKRLVDIGIKGSNTALDQHAQTVDRLYKLPEVSKIDRGYFDIPKLSYVDWAKANPAGSSAAPDAPAAPKGPPGADFNKYEYRPNPNVPSGYDRRPKR